MYKRLMAVSRGHVRGAIPSQRVYVRLTHEARELLRKKWEERTYPNPNDNSEVMKFRSEQEYLEFVVRCLNECSEQSWYYFKHLFNPNFKEVLA